MIRNRTLLLVGRGFLLLLSASAIVLRLFFPITWQPDLNAYSIAFTIDFWPLSTFTTLSNLAVLAFYAAAFVVSLRERGKSGSHGEIVALPRLQSCICTAIFFTMVIYWAIIADWASKNTFTYTNIALHFFIPLGFFADYILFRAPGRMRKLDILFTYLSALLYFTAVSIMGVFHLHDYNIGSSKAPLVNWWPYGFLNYGALGIAPVFIVLGIGMVYLGFSVGLYHIDRRVGLTSGTLKRSNV
jgi:hypothetical protein